MPEAERADRELDWTLTTWEGAQREKLRRWAALSLEEILLAQEEMQQIADWLSGRSAPERLP